MRRFSLFFRFTLTPSFAPPSLLPWPQNRYRPEVAKAVKGYATSTSDGIALDIGVTAEGSKIAVEPVYPGYASATHPNVVRE